MVRETQARHPSWSPGFNFGNLYVLNKTEIHMGDNVNIGRDSNAPIAMKGAMQEVGTSTVQGAPSPPPPTPGPAFWIWLVEKVGVPLALAIVTGCTTIVGVVIGAWAQGYFGK